MIGYLPEALEINGRDYEINTDYRVALTIFEALADPDLSQNEKAWVMLNCLYVDEIDYEDIEEACKQASIYLDGGEVKEKKDEKPILDWEQDEKLIFSAVNKVAGKEIRAEQYMHWWTFLSYFQEIDEKSLFTTVVQIRVKKKKGKKLDKWEQDFYKSHRDMIDIKRKLSKEEQEERDAINRILNGGE